MLLDEPDIDAVLQEKETDFEDTIIGIIEEQAQSIVNAVMHYLYSPETSDIPQMAPSDTAAIETIVRRIMEEQIKESPDSSKPAECKLTKSSEITHTSHP